MSFLSKHFTLKLSECFSSHCFAVFSQIHAHNNEANHPCVPAGSNSENWGPDTRRLHFEWDEQTSRFVIDFWYVFLVADIFTFTVVWFTSSLSLPLPENSDISVSCGTQSIDLNIYLCPMYQALYNESLMVLNNQFTKPTCLGTADWTVIPPVLKFKIPLNETAISACGNSFRVFFKITLLIICKFTSTEKPHLLEAVFIPSL